MNNRPPSRRDLFQWGRSNSVDAKTDAGLATPPSQSAPTTVGSSFILQNRIDCPPSHGSVDPAILPPVTEVLLGDSDVIQLLADIGSCASQITLMHRRLTSNASGGSSGIGSAQLMAAWDILRTGQTNRLQIRYIWAQASWIDTIESRPEGFRLVRIQHTLRD